MIKLNFGCGFNKLQGWRNFDVDRSLGEYADISKPLTFHNDYADCIFSEHCVEHITYEQALNFFRECARVLKSGGTIRIHVPSVENIYQNSDQNYWNFTTKWQPDATRRGALKNIMFHHGHKMIWSEGTLIPALYVCGFRDLCHMSIYSSEYEHFEFIAGHGKVIGEEFNALETIAIEGKVDK